MRTEQLVNVSVGILKVESFWQCSIVEAVQAFERKTRHCTVGTFEFLTIELGFGFGS